MSEREAQNWREISKENDGNLFQDEGHKEEDKAKRWDEKMLMLEAIHCEISSQAGAIIEDWETEDLSVESAWKGGYEEFHQSELC